MAEGRGAGSLIGLFVPSPNLPHQRHTADCVAKHKPMAEGPRPKCDTANNGIIVNRAPEVTIQYPPCTTITVRISGEASSGRHWPAMWEISSYNVARSRTHAGSLKNATVKGRSVQCRDTDHCAAAPDAWQAQKEIAVTCLCV